MGFLRGMQIDRLSFWLGFLAGFLLLWLLSKLRPALRSSWGFVKQTFQAARSEMQTGTEVRHRNDVIRYAQGLHIANPMFSLDELIIEPRLLAPPPVVAPGVLPPPPDITEKVLPYLPDWPALPGMYGAPTLSMIEALQGGTNLAILGEPGSGKTVALAYLASRLARHSEELGLFKDHVPFLLHAADLSLASNPPPPPLDILLDAIGSHASAMTLPRLANFVRLIFEQGRAVLLLDGLDELPPSGVEEVVQFLSAVCEQYPRIRLVLAVGWVSPCLRLLNASLLGLAGWDVRQRHAMIEKWGNLWQRWIAKPVEQGGQPLQDDILNAWLVSDLTPLTPLELTLKVWAAYAGDAVGSSAVEALEAYLGRMVVGVPKGRQALEQLAAQMVMTLRPVMTGREAQSAIAAFEPSASLAEAELPSTSDEADETAPAPEPAAQSKPAAPGSIHTSRVLPGLIDNGILFNHGSSRLSFAHPALQGYLAAQALAGSEGVENLLSQPEWSGKTLTLQFVAARQDISRWLSEIQEDLTLDPLQTGLFGTARWLPYAPEAFPWRSHVMRELSNLVQNRELAFNLRARALAALTASGSSGSALLFRQMLSSSDPVDRSLAALGCGGMRDTKAVQNLNDLYSDLNPSVRQAICLGLVAIGDQPALEAVASALLHGDEALRIAAAEALANHPEEGYPVLEEASAMDDLLVRRAAVSGLGRIRQPWALEILHKLQVEDNQWVVQNAATQTLEEIAQPDPRIPRPLPELSETPWLIAFAGEHGVGVAPGRPARELLFKALREGDEDQRLAALAYLERYGDETAVLPIYEIYFPSQGDIREAAFVALWSLRAAGVPLPQPVQFGLH